MKLFEKYVWWKLPVLVPLVLVLVPILFPVIWLKVILEMLTDLIEHIERFLNSQLEQPVNRIFNWTKRKEDDE